LNWQIMQRHNEVPTKAAAHVMDTIQSFTLHKELLRSGVL
jgi:hypothetical protein